MNSFSSASFFAESVLAYEDCVTKSGILPEIYHLNVEPASGFPVYDLLFRDTDPTTNSSSGSAQAKRNFAKCEGALGFIINGRFRQLAGPPIAFSKKKNKGFGKTEELEPRKYHQPYGKPLEIFFPLVTVAVWEAIAAKNNLPMPKFPAVGLKGEALGFWEWVEVTNCPVILTEGEKKALALISRGYAAIGLPGINTGYRVTERGETVTNPNGTKYDRAIAWELRSELQRFDTSGREITIIFDHRAGDYRQSQEFRAATTTTKLLKNAIAKIAILPGPDKGVDDFLVGGGDLEKILSEATTLDKEALIKEWKYQKWLRLRGFTPDRVINSKYYDEPAPEFGVVTAGKSGMGTGKTEHIKNKVASDPRGLQLNLGYRNSLLLQQCQKWGSNHWDEHNGYLFTKDPDGRLSLCVDSLLKLPIEMFENAVQHCVGMTVILDEAVSVIKHLLLSGTLLGKRLETLERFEMVCRLAGRIVLSDGNLSDIVVDYISEISGKPSVKIQNVYQGDTPPITFMELGRVGMSEWLADQVLKSPCPAVSIDSRISAEALALRLREERGYGILLTSKTVAEKVQRDEEDMKEFIKDSDAFIKKYKPNWIIFSPTGESGIDISIRDYFSDVFGWFVGVVGVDECLQMVRRVRHPERITILSPERGLGRGVGSGGGFLEKEVIQAFADLGDLEAQLLLEGEDLQKVRQDRLAQLDTPHTRLLGKLLAKAELERQSLREYLIKAFELSGYSVGFVAGGQEKGAPKPHAEAKEECKKIESEEIFNAEDIDLTEAQKISRDWGATWSDRCKAEKARYKERLPGIENSNLWEWEFIYRVRFEERELLRQLDADWIYQNQEDAEYLQRQKLKSRILAGKREFMGDFYDRWLKIKVLRELNLEKFLEPGKIWTKESPEVLEVFKLCSKKAIAKVLGHPGKMQPIQWLNKLLKVLGHKLGGTKKKENGETWWEYFYNPALGRPKNWDELAAFTSEKWAKIILQVKEAEAIAAQELEAVPATPVFITDLRVAGTQESEDFTPQTSIEVVAEVTPEIMSEVETPAVEIFAAQIEAIPELPGELPTSTPIANLAPWFQRGKEWIKCRVLEFVEGRYLLEAKSMVNDGLVRFRAFPEDLRWEAPT
jgi:hypothetical protein